MDLLFSKYANPYLLLDQVIEEKRLIEFNNKSFSLVSKVCVLSSFFICGKIDKNVFYIIE